MTKSGREWIAVFQVCSHCMLFGYASNSRWSFFISPRRWRKMNSRLNPGTCSHIRSCRWQRVPSLSSPFVERHVETRSPPSVCSFFGVLSSLLQFRKDEGRKGGGGGGEILIPKFGGGAKSQSRQFFLDSHAREGRKEGGDDRGGLVRPRPPPATFS